MGSVFTGIGGLDEAGKRSGYEAKFAIEKEAQYAEIYENNNSNVEVHNSDIANVEYSKLQKVELLVGGIPCEPFSQVRRKLSRRRSSGTARECGSVNALSAAGRARQSKEHSS